MDKIFPELEFILSALRFWVRPEAAAARDLVRRTKEVPSWQPVLKLAARHRVLPFIVLALDKSGALREISLEVRTVLEKDLQSAVLDNRAKRLEFKRYNAWFEQAGLPVIPLKGIALTETVYRETPARRMGDIDLLIREGDLPKAEAFLQERGFFAPPLVNGWHTPISEKIEGKGSRVRGNSELLDLQWAPRLFIGNAFARVPLERAWHRAQACPALGPNVSILDPSDQANHLLYQAAGDYCKDYLFLYQLLDLAAVLEAGHLSADALAVEGAPPSSRKVLEDLRRAVDELFFRGAARREMSDPTRSLCAKLQSGPDAPEPQAFFFKIAGLPFLSPGEKFLMYLGYFIPDSKRLRQDFGEGWAGLLKGWIHHWTRFIKRALKVATGAFQ